ncbi:Imm26 family immunity protein [Gelidibacter sp. F63206]|uniref:Imm26 family immunity protein n=1 Tax=Gelidibacter sp. F63206 TaxID=2926425 RepID=UPI001FF69FBA|nr:Imm26 family immunity protein [Gelidibacter sp. F63206]MCK0115021.1 immunity 26/phosphotriesterase HocA family protein [Gelidibacter sp. F63206]
MKKQIRTIGAIVEIDLKNGDYCYAQILNDGLAFYDLKVKEKLSDFDVLLECPVLFFLSVYRDAISQGRWLKVGKLTIRKEFEVLPMKFIQDGLNPNIFELYNPNTGDITRTTKDKITGLERAAVWEANHVEDRLRDYYDGKPNVWLEQLKPQG